MKRLAYLVLPGALLLSCAALDKPVMISDPATGEVRESTVGDVTADVVDSVGAEVGSTAANLISVATGNPVIGAGAGATIVALLASASSKLRRKKKQQDGEEPS